MAEIYDLAVTDGNNTGRFPEGQAPSTVNNGARALEGLLARGLKDTINPDKTTTGSANAQALTPNATVATLTAGMMFTWKAGYTNTAAMTLNVADTAATGAKSVKTTNGSDPWAGAVTVGGYYTTIYDGTNHVLLNPSGIGDGAVTLAKMANLAQDKLIGRATASTGVPEAVGLDATLAMDTGNLKVVDASETQKGAVEKATQAETNSGTAGKYPSAAEVVAMKSASSTFPLALGGSSRTIAHGLGVKPRDAQLYIRCKNSEHGYSVGDDVPVTMHYDAGSYSGYAYVIDATNCGYVFGTLGIRVLNAGTGVVASVTLGNWEAFIVASV